MLGFVSNRFDVAVSILSIQQHNIITPFSSSLHAPPTPRQEISHSSVVHSINKLAALMTSSFVCVQMKKSGRGEKPVQTNRGGDPFIDGRWEVATLLSPLDEVIDS